MSECRVQGCRNGGDPNVFLRFEVHHEPMEVAVPMCDLHKGLVCAHEGGAPVFFDISLGLR